MTAAARCAGRPGRTPRPTPRKRATAGVSCARDRGHTVKVIAVSSPNSAAEREDARIDAEGDGSREQLLEQPADRDRRERAGGEPRQHPEPRQHGKLGEVGREHDPARGADALEGRDHREPSVEPRADRVADPDPADEKGGEADEAQERPEPPHHPLDAGGGVLVAPDPPAARAQPLVEVRPNRRRLCTLGQAQRVLVVDEAAFAEESRLGERVQADQDPRPKAERPPGARPIGLVLDGPPHLDLDAADGEGVPVLEAEPVDEGGIDERPPPAPPPGRALAAGRRRSRRRAGPRTVPKRG